MGPFFKQLGDAVLSLGHDVLRINFNGGDLHFWDNAQAVDFNGELEDWHDYITDVLRLRRITDIIVYNDCRPLHRVALDAAHTLGIRIYVFEEGYLRPNWVTFSANGVNANGEIPDDPDFYRNQSPYQERDVYQVRHTSFSMSLYALGYYLASLPGGIRRYNAYKHHYGVCPHHFMQVWAKRIFTMPYRKIEARIKRRRVKGKDFYLVPLQLDRDTQITCHSRFDNVKEFISEVMESFAKHAPAHTTIVFKNHPLDNSISRLGQHVRYEAKRLAISSRTLYLDGGKLPYLLRRTKGVVVINSTSGISAIHHRLPVITLGAAIYHMPGLTYQGTLNQFWTTREQPDYALYQSFRQYLLKHHQLNGSFYTRKGRELLIRQTLVALHIVPAFTAATSVHTTEEY